MNQKILFPFLILGFVLSLMAGLVQGKTTQQQPPSYPEVWGYDLANYPQLPHGFESPRPYTNHKGELIFQLSRCIKACDSEEEEDKVFDYALLYFFSGRVELFSGNQEKKVLSKLNRVSMTDSITLKDKTRIEMYYDFTGKLCQPNYLLSTIILKGKLNGSEEKLSVYEGEIEKLSVIAAFPSIRTYTDKEDGFCDRGGPLGGQLIYQWLYPLKNFIKLKDDTFIMIGGNLIIRFDRNFNTQFKSKTHIKLSANETIDRNFFVLPYATIEKLDEKVMENRDHGVQGLHDQLLLYLYEQPIKEEEERERKYPPYPDVWGYDFTEYSPSALYLESDKTGDIILDIHSRSNKKSIPNTAIIHLFSSEKFIANRSQYKKYKDHRKKYGVKSISEYKNYTFLKDGSIIEYNCKVYANDRLKNCFIEKKDLSPENGKLNSHTKQKKAEKFSVFVVEPAVRDSGSAKEFELCQIFSFYELKDETFLLSGNHCSVVLRFDKNMKTRFKPKNKIGLGRGKILNSNFFVLPYGKLQYFYNHIVKGYTGELTQDVTLQFLNYLYDEQEKGNLQN